MLASEKQVVVLVIYFLKRELRFRMKSSISVVELVKNYPHDLMRSGRDFVAESKTAVREAFRSDGRLHWGALACIVLIAAFIRGYFLFVRPITYDESTTFLLYASRSLYDAVSLYFDTNNHLLNSVMMHFSYLIFGINPIGVRLPVFLVGLCGIPATYVCIRTLYNKDAALLASALVSASSYLIKYGSEARGYAFVWLFFLILVTLAEMLRRRWSTFLSFICALVAALMVYSVLVGFYGLAVITVWLGLLLILDRKTQPWPIVVRDSLVVVILSAILTVLLYLPLVLRQGLSKLFVNSVIHPVSLADTLAGNQVQLATTWKLFNNAIPAWLGMVVVLLFVFAIVMNGRISDNKIPLPLVAVIVLPLVVLAQRVVVFARIWTFLLPIYMGVSAAGLVYLMKVSSRVFSGRMQAIALPAISIIAAIGLGLSVYQVQEGSYWGLGPVEKASERIAVYIGKNIHPEDSVLSQLNNYPQIRYYLVLHYGFSTTDYLTATSILNGQIPQRVFIILMKDNGTLRGSPQDVLTARHLKPDDYTVSPDPEVFGDVYIYIAQHKP